MTPRRLSEILHGKDSSALQRAWDSTQAATEFTPLPPGTYECRIVGGEFTNAKTGTPSYRLTFKVIDGEHAERRLFLDLWLTNAALSMTKRDLIKLGVNSLAQLDKPLPPGIRAKVKIALREDDNGEKRNRVCGFTVVGIDPPEANPFAPVDPPPSGGPVGDHNDTGGRGDISFPFGLNAINEEVAQL